MADEPRRHVGVEFELLRIMSKHNNVNPGQYKVGGRLHPGDDSSRQEEAKAEAAITEQASREEPRRGKKGEPQRKGGPGNS